MGYDPAAHMDGRALVVTLARTADRIAKRAAAIVLAVVMAFAQIGSVAASISCLDASARTVGSPHYPDHVAARMDHMSHHATNVAQVHPHKAGAASGAEHHGCCNNGCLGCTPAIIVADIGIPAAEATSPFTAAGDTVAIGRSPPPLLGPPRSQT